MNITPHIIIEVFEKKFYNTKKEEVWSNKNKSHYTAYGRKRIPHYTANACQIR